MDDNLIIGIFVLIAAIIGFRFGIAVSIFEIAAGIIAGNYLGVGVSEWLNKFAEDAGRGNRTDHIMVKQKMMRIYLEEEDEYYGQPLYHAVVLRLQELGMAGATVYKGIKVMGRYNRLRKAKTFLISEDLPVAGLR